MKKRILSFLLASLLLTGCTPNHSVAITQSESDTNSTSITSSTNRNKSSISIVGSNNVITSNSSSSETVITINGFIITVHGNCSYQIVDDSLTITTSTDSFSFLIEQDMSFSILEDGTISIDE